MSRHRGSSFILLLFALFLLVVAVLKWGGVEVNVIESPETVNETEKEVNVNSVNTNTTESNTNSNTNTNVNNENAATNENINTSVNAAPLSTDSREYGFTLPGLEVAEAIPSGDTVAYVYTDENALSVFTSDTSSIIRGSYGVSSETVITVDGHTGARIVGSSPKDGSVVHYMIIENGEDILFVRGNETFLDEVTASLNFIDND